MKVYCLTDNIISNINTQRRFTSSRQNQNCTEIVAILSVLVDKYYTKLNELFKIGNTLLEYMIEIRPNNRTIN